MQLLDSSIYEADTPKIQRVPDILLQTDPNARCYDPGLVSIGPRGYYKGMIPFKPSDKFKKSVVEHYAREGLSNKLSLEEAYQRVKHVLLRARDCYAEGFLDNKLAHDDNTFGRMMFVDGLFLVEFIHSEVTGSSMLRMSKGDRDSVRRDVLLLENQVPLKILKTLAEFMYDMNSEQSLQIFGQFLSQLIASPFHRQTRNHRYFKYSTIFSLCCGDYEAPGLGLLTFTIYPIHLLDLLRRSSFFNDELTLPDRESNVLAFPSATELKKVGIHCAPSRINLEFYFRSYRLSGALVVPLLTIDKWTKPMFLNLLALCTTSQDEDDHRSLWSISSYLWLMHNLIEKPEDVKELQSRGILHNNLSDEQAVVDLFREIAMDVEPDRPPFLYVRRQISEYLTSRRLPLRVIFAEFKHRYFSSPWSILVFFAIIFTVSLTIIQTVLAVIQTHLAGIQTYLAAHPPTKK